MIPAAFYRSAFCCSLVPAGLANTNFPHKGIIKIGNDFPRIIQYTIRDFYPLTCTISSMMMFMRFLLYNFINSHDFVPTKQLTTKNGL